MNQKILIIIAIVGTVLLGVIAAVFFFSGNDEPSSLGPASLTFWSIEEDDAWQKIITQFQQTYPGITVSYTAIPESAYEEALVSSLAQGTGPDVFVLKNSWIAEHANKTFPLPQEFFQFFRNAFEDDFTDGATRDLVLQNGEIIGLPLWVDTPVLLYNKDIFNTAGVAAPPKNWNEVIQVSRLLTKKAPGGGIIQSGIAMGTYDNVERAFEIISSLILQKEDPIIDRATGRAVLDDRAEEAILFYTSFANPLLQNYSWTSKKKNSLDAFAEGEAAMAIAFSRDIARVSEKNPLINFGVLPFPQRKDAALQTLYGEYFFPTVSKFSQNPGPAWQFVFFATGKEPSRIFWEQTGLPPVRRDIIADPPKDTRSIFFRQSLIANGWPVPDEEAANKLFGDMIDAVNTRTLDAKDALNRMRQRLNLFLP